MEYYLEQTKETQKQRKCIYHCPLPRKKQRVQARGRSGKVIVYDRKQIELYLNGLEVQDARRTAKD